jgi:alginate lyase
MNRRQFLLGLPAPLLGAAVRQRPLVLISEDEAAHMRDAAQGRPVLDKLTGAALRAGPWSVTFRRPTGLKVDAGPNDYVSEGPYWWPDPKNPNGPYINRDGHWNPDRFTGNRFDLADMCEAVLTLGMGAFLLRRAACSERANRVVPVWFLDPKTRMNPNLEHGQMIRGVNTGRGTGIIDTVWLIRAAQGVALLEMAGGFDPGIAAGVRQWYADYLKWMTTSEKGIDEKTHNQNHSTWWTAQAGAYGWFLNDAAVRSMAWNYYRSYLVPVQVEPDGSCPREERRTNSLNYSTMNLNGFSLICRMAQLDGVDLWRFRTEKGIGMEKSFHYLMPYVLRPETWRKQQISKYDPSGAIFLGVAGLGLKSGELLGAYRTLPRAESAWGQFFELLAGGGAA